MTTVALLRTTYLNEYLRRKDTSTVPWTTAQADRAIVDALTALWQDGVGKKVQGTATPTTSTDVYSIPALLLPGRISRIELEQASGGVSGRVGRVTNWQMYSDTQVRIRPPLANDTTLTLRFFGWAPYGVDGADLPVRLEAAVAMKAAALAYGQQLGQLANSQTQQGLDGGRVVDYPTDVGLSAYWERRYRDAIGGDQAMMSLAPRRARR